MKPISEMTDRELLEYLTETIAHQSNRMDQLTETVAHQSDRMDQLTETVAHQDGHIEQLAGSVRDINLVLENEIRPDIQTLAEGHDLILDKLNSVVANSRVEALEDDVALLKQALRSVSQQLAELKKAQ